MISEVIRMWYGSGSRSGIKALTSTFLRLDIRWMDRDGCLIVGKVFTLEWSRRGEQLGSISGRDRKSVV